MNGAAVFCMNPDRTKVLFGRRRAGPNEGKWVLPGGGHVTGEESIVDAAVREFYEETGMLLVVSNRRHHPSAVLVSPLPAPPPYTESASNTPQPEHHVHMPDGRIIYFFRAVSNTETLDQMHGQEFSELRFMTAEEARALAKESGLTTTVGAVLLNMWPEFAKLAR